MGGSTFPQPDAYQLLLTDAKEEPTGRMLKARDWVLSPHATSEEFSTCGVSFLWQSEGIPEVPTFILIFCHFIYA